MTRDILITPSEIKVGDWLTFREGVSDMELIHGDLLEVTKIFSKHDMDTNPNECPIYVWSPNKRVSYPSLNKKHRGYGFFSWKYDYYDTGICSDCSGSCKEKGKTECPFYTERGDNR